jgi:hypothetical protein
MARLILSLENQVLAEYNMNKERYTVGRLPDNDVRIDNPAVSGHHALIINILNDSFLEDLNSTNGTYVNGKLIKKHALQHGDLITCGHHQLRFIDSQSSENEPDEFEKTMVLQPSAATEERIRATRAEPTPSPTAAQANETGSMAAVPPKAKLQVLSGAFAGRELELIKTVTMVGRPGVQIAALTRRADGFYLVQVESANGEFAQINGTPIGEQARKLRDNDVITLAGVKMGFFVN